MNHRQTTVNARSKNPRILEDVLNSVESLSKKGNGPSFNSLLAYLQSRQIVSNHRSLRAYLDLALMSGMLAVREEKTEQLNIRPSQIYSLTDDGPYVVAGEKALLFYGLNWTLPSARPLRIRTDVEGLARARLAREAVYSSLEDAIVQALAHRKDVIFCAVLLATKKLEYGYLMRRAEENGVQDIVSTLQTEIDYLLWAPSPTVDDIRTLFEIRNRLAHRRPTTQTTRTLKWPLSLDELVDAIGKQLGVK